MIAILAIGALEHTCFSLRHNYLPNGQIAEQISAKMPKINKRRKYLLILILCFLKNIINRTKKHLRKEKKRKEKEK